MEIYRVSHMSLAGSRGLAFRSASGASANRQNPLFANLRTTSVLHHPALCFIMGTLEEFKSMPTVTVDRDILHDQPRSVESLSCIVVELSGCLTVQLAKSRIQAFSSTISLARQGSMTLVQTQSSPIQETLQHFRNGAVDHPREQALGTPVQTRELRALHQISSYMYRLDSILLLKWS